jgi:hypothetical protein
VGGASPRRLQSCLATESNIPWDPADSECPIVNVIEPL